ncbi:MAG: phosphatidylcholine/phosphatidylserine synthase [Hyphomicrobiaceae bacterium]
MLAAAAVHLLTGLGALCALFATEAAIAGAFERMFVWLGIAFVIDGIDGPIARAIGVVERLPRFSGERIDLVIDYLTYVFVPVLALLVAGRIGPPAVAYTLAALVLLSSLFHFADVESKADELAFVGFPAIWNIAAFYVFAFEMSPGAVQLLILAGVVLTFVPMHWVHPVRVLALRPVTLIMTAAWAGAAAWAASVGFPAPWPARLLLGVCAVYGLALSIWLTFAARQRAPRAHSDSNNP